MASASLRWAFVAARKSRSLRDPNRRRRGRRDGRPRASQNRLGGRVKCSLAPTARSKLSRSTRHNSLTYPAHPRPPPPPPPPPPCAPRRNNTPPKLDIESPSPPLVAPMSSDNERTRTLPLPQWHSMFSDSCPSDGESAGSIRPRNKSTRSRRRGRGRPSCVLALVSVAVYLLTPSTPPLGRPRARGGCTLAWATDYCYIQTESRAPFGYENCYLSASARWFNNTKAATLDCKASDTKEYSKDCRELLMETNIKFCSLTIKLTKYTEHAQLINPALLIKCKGAKIATELILRDFNKIEPKRLFIGQAAKTMDFKRLVLQKNRHEGAKFEWPLERLDHVVDDIVPKAIVLQDLENLVPLVMKPMYDTNLTIIGGMYGNMEKDALRLQDFESFIMDGVKVDEGRHIASGAIQLFFAECKHELSHIKFKKLDLSKLQPNPIAIKMNCSKRGALNIDMTDNNFWPIAPKQILKSILDSLSDESKVILNLKLDPIECCAANNAWLADSVSRLRAGGVGLSRIHANCYDIGKTIMSYDGAKLKNACENRNVMPIYMIGIITAAVIGILLFILSCVCIMCVRPKKKVDRAPPTSTAARPGSGNSSGASSAVTELNSETGMSAKLGPSRSNVVSPRSSISHSKKQTRKPKKAIMGSPKPSRSSSSSIQKKKMGIRTIKEGNQENSIFQTVS